MFRDMRELIPRRSLSNATGRDVERDLDGGKLRAFILRSPHFLCAHLTLDGTSPPSQSLLLPAFDGSPIIFAPSLPRPGARLPRV